MSIKYNFHLMKYFIPHEGHKFTLNVNPIIPDNIHNQLFIRIIPAI